MSSGQSLRNGNSVEPGLPNTFLMPKARKRSKVACLTVMDVWVVVFVGLRDDICNPGEKGRWINLRHSGAMRSIEPGISRFRVWSFGPSRNDGGESRAVIARSEATKQSRLVPRIHFWIASLCSQ